MTIDMTFERREELIREEERQYGRLETGRLIAWLFSQNRVDDVQRAATDPEYMDKMFEEYRIKETAEEEDKKRR